MDIQQVSSVVAAQPVRMQENPVRLILPSRVKEAKQPSSEELKASVDKINQTFQKNDVALDFSVDDRTSIPVVKVTNTSTGDIIMQFPSKVVLAISEAIDHNQTGALIRDKA